MLLKENIAELDRQVGAPLTMISETESSVFIYILRPIA